ncbi:UNVERIFIED_CONTAM: putative ubiquitin-conjugating enzyme E2 24 [Sesamum angustifolium]|uniref:E2 ubiquitin-conjugating enzyme n=1 Tax=Sesamum angustifolium TaxID=2727405 RepID=A0AAW2KW90_9LAMI
MDSLLSDFDSFSDSSSSEDQEDIESLYGGQACTIFSSLEETIEKIDDFLLFERGFLHGDIVCLVSDPLGQMGKVINVEMTVDLEKIDGSKIRNVSSRDLQKIRSLSVGDYVVHGPEKIVALSPDIVEDPQYPFYPGERVQIESSSVSRSTRWLCGIRKDKHEQGIVSNVDAGLVYVDWLGCAVIDGERGPAPGTADDSQVPGFQRWGVVRSVDPKERTVKVKWCKSSLNLLDSKEEQMEETVSAYELVEHPDYSYCLGEAVFRTDKSIVDLRDVDHERNCSISEMYMGEDADSKGVEISRDKFLSYFGTVVGLGHGDVEVKWATGATTKDTLGLDCNNAKESSSNFISQVAIGFFSSITSSLFGSLTASLISGYKYPSECGQINGNPPEEESLELCNLNLGDQFPAADDLEMPEKTTPLQIKEADEDIMMPSSSKNPESFRQFDMVNDCSDHHFVKESGMDLHSPQVKRGWLKKVHQEWSILEKDLPETIYVRVYEERMDLVRAAIVGTAGTPYHDGLFFFDIYIPPQYPNEPPMVYYNSGGLRINPNLYESGRVCLSLLNTWAGSQTEVWNPGSSTILQVLLSLQALVLNEKPYFNEAGYDTQIGKAEGEKNSVSYNENAFLVSCRSMLYLLRKPPKSAKQKYLIGCKAYMQGARIGHPFNSENADQETQKGSSTGFKIMLSKLYSRLVEAFLDKGFDCSNLPDQVP